MAPLQFLSQGHGKSRVRVGRVWREGPKHYFVEWNAQIILDSDCLIAYTEGDNGPIVATDTCKNTVYYIAKQQKTRCTVEEFATALAEHFIRKYPHVTVASIDVEEKAWTRITIDGEPHDHGFAENGTQQATASVVASRGKSTVVTAGVRDMRVLKTTQSGFEGYYKDDLTILPPTSDRILATAITCKWSYAAKPSSYEDVRETVYTALKEAFYGPPHKGVYSPSVQQTLYVMAQLTLDRCPSVETVFLRMPNLHFLPMNSPALNIKFENDVYIPTDEPHGNISALLSRGAPLRLSSRL
eukprot:jgi/Chlat1/4371/Chrsp29S04516